MCYAAVFLRCKFQIERSSQWGVGWQNRFEASGRVGAILTTVASPGQPGSFLALAMVQFAMDAWIFESNLASFNQYLYEYMHAYGLYCGGAAVLLPGTISWWQNGWRCSSASMTWCIYVSILCYIETLQLWWQLKTKLKIETVNDIDIKLQWY